MRIPNKPHSQAGFITSATDGNYLTVNVKSFDPYGQIIGGTTTMWDKCIYLAMTNGVSIKDEKEITTAEEAAAKLYPAYLMSYLQDLRAKKNIIDKAPIFVANISTSDGIFKEDEWWFELQMASNGNYVSIPGIEDFIHRINPVWRLSDPYEMLNFPASYYLQWVPSYTTTELRALRVLMATYSEAFQTFCNKVKISTSTLDAKAFTDRTATEFSPLSYNDKDWLFWNASGHYFNIRNGANTGNNLMTSRLWAAGEAFDVTTANWLSARDKYYIIPPDGEPSDLCAIIQMFYPHNAENLMGCVVNDDGGGINDDTLQNVADVAGATLSRQDPGGASDTAFAAMDRGNVGNMFNAFPSLFASQTFADARFDKHTDEASEESAVSHIQMAGGLRFLPYDTSIWDNVNGLIIQTFFQELFGKPSKSVTLEKPKFSRKKVKKVD